MKLLGEFVKPVLFVAAVTMALGAAAQGSTEQSRPAKGNWNAVIAETNGGHRMGNPQASARLVEFMSYTCSHCADFARAGDGAIKMLYVPSGKVSYEIRHLVRDPVDLTAALAARCGPADKFFKNHEAILSRHDQWMATIKTMTEAQLVRWQSGSFGSRAQAIASDLGFYAIMAGRGYSRSELNQCLADDATAKAVAEQSEADVTALGLKGTPTFVLDGKTLDNVHSWPALQPVLDKVF